MELSQRLDSAQPQDVRTRAARDLADLVLPTVQAYVRARCDWNDPVDDLLSQVWVRVFTAIEHGDYCHDQGANPTGWVLGIADHVIQQSHRTKALHRSHEVPWDDAFDMEEEVSEMEEQYDLSWFDRLDLSSLTDEERQTLEMMRTGKPIREMAITWQVSYKTAWRRFHRILTYCQHQVAMIPQTERV